MKLSKLFFILLVLVSCKETEATKTQTMENNSSALSFYVGTYTNGNSEGIYKFKLLNDGTFERSGLVARTQNPSFLSFNRDKTVLLAVNENESGTIESYLIKPDTLIRQSQSSTGGAHPCFVNANTDGYVLTANYTGGNVGLLKLNENGELSELLDVQQHSGKGITDRQDGPHAHSVWFSPYSDQVISVDLGTNELWLSKIDTATNKLLPTDPVKFALPEGSGPRHLTFHPNKQWIYVLNELSNTVTRIIKKEEGYKIAETVSTLPEDFTEFSKAADIHISADGTFIYASNRGHNSIAILKLNTEGALELIGNEPTRGHEPRNFKLSPDENFLVVANQKTNTLVSFKRDDQSGLLTYLSETEAPSPVCILFE